MSSVAAVTGCSCRLQAALVMIAAFLYGCTSAPVPVSERDVSDYRITTQIAWEIVIDEVNNLSLKISALDRYDSTPSGGTPNALDYAATLLWSF